MTGLTVYSVWIVATNIAPRPEAGPPGPWREGDGEVHVHASLPCRPRLRAQVLELHWSYLGQAERGRRNVTLHNILKLAEILGVDAADLVRGLHSL